MYQTKAAIKSVGVVSQLLAIIVIIAKMSGVDIAPGRAHAVLKGTPGVTSSRAAFKDLMHRLARRDQWRIAIKWTTPEGA